MKRKTWKINSGFTLIEVLIVTAIMSIFSIFLVDLVTTTQKAWSIENTSVPVRGEAKRTLEVIAKELREADPSAPSSVTIGGSGTSQSITFSVPNQVSQSTILSWRQIQFAHDLIQKQVTRTVGGITTIVSRDINSLQFSQSNNVVTVTVGTNKLTAEGIMLQTTIGSQIRMRN